MQDSRAIREDLIAIFKGFTADGKSIEESPHFEDYVNIGVCLSQGPRAPANKTALLALEEATIKRIKNSVDQAKGAQAYFQAIKEHHENQGPAVPKDKDYSKLLSGSLDEFERQHGFVVVGERLPNYVGFIGGTVFAEALSQGYHWKDIGAEEVHGEYTHRLQWYLVISAGVIKTVSSNQEVTVYKSIAGWQIVRKSKYLWTRLFDLNSWDTAINGDKEDFRCPENLNGWLTGTEAPEFCPVLRSFLRARMAKRAATFSALNPEPYLKKKLGWSEEDIRWYKSWVQTEEGQKKRPSLRIIFPQGEKPVLSPYVNEKKRF
jgi:Family of unknown function (DUF5636)